jgi:hypothetical protein
MTRGKELALLGGATALCLVALELASRLLGASVPEVPLYEEPERAPEEFRADIVIHPYLGFVGAPLPGSNRNRYGFAGREPPLEKPADAVVIGIFGGSVAAQFCSREALIPALRSRDPSLAGKDVWLVCGALGGFKQPQQLMALNYFLVLGAHFDAVLELDGLNEVAASQTTTVSHLYPRNWHLISQKGWEGDAALQMVRVLALKERKRTWERLLRREPFESSAFLSLVARLIHNRAVREIGEANLRLDALMADQALEYQATGPAKAYDEEGFLADSVRLWSDASLLMSDICRARDIAYLHFLQPHRYHSRKPLTAAERKSHHARQERRNGRGYRLLLEERAEIEAAGVAFYDLTPIFDAEQQTIYVDQAHFNAEGNRILGERIADALIEVMKRRG